MTKKESIRQWTCRFTGLHCTRKSLSKYVPTSWGRGIATPGIALLGFHASAKVVWILEKQAKLSRSLSIVFFFFRELVYGNDITLYTSKCTVSDRYHNGRIYLAENSS